MSTVIDLRAYTEASQAFYERTGRLLTIYEYRKMVEGAPSPLATVLMAAEFARKAALDDADDAEYREEMSLGGAIHDA